MPDRDYLDVVVELDDKSRRELMKNEYERLRTFQDRWPSPEFININDLARSGFYYTGQARVILSYISQTLSELMIGRCVAFRLFYVRK